MSKFLLGGAAAAAMIAIAPAIAQTAPPAPQPMVQRAPLAAKAHTRADVGAHIRSIFERLDANRDGYVTKAEVEARRGDRRERVARRVERRGGGGGQPADRRGMFDRIDTNRDGAISRAEFEAAPARQERRIMIADGTPGGGRMMRGMRGMRMGAGHFGGQMFDMADTNRDGRVTLQEATAAAYRHFDMADANRDGQITREERRQMHQRMRAERRPG